MQLRYLVALAILALIPYIINGYEFAHCDFEPDYKCELIHGIGVIIPPAAYVTVWFDSDSEVRSDN